MKEEWGTSGGRLMRLTMEDHVRTPTSEAEKIPRDEISTNSIHPQKPCLSLVPLYSALIAEIY